MKHIRYIICIVFILSLLYTRIRPVSGIFISDTDTSVDLRTRTESLTGRNRALHGFVTTGDATTESVVESTVNTVIVDCCSPTPKPSDTSAPTPTPSPGQPTLTPTPSSSNGGGGENGGGNGGNGDGASTGGGDVSGITTSQGEVLGLAATGSIYWPTVFQGAGLLCLGLGLRTKKRANA